MDPTRGKQGTGQEFVVVEKYGQYIVVHQPSGAAYSISDPTSHTELINSIRKINKLLKSVGFEDV